MLKKSAFANLKIPSASVGEELWFLSSSGIHGATITHLNVHRSCRWIRVDAFKSPPTKCSEDWDPLVNYKSLTSPTIPQALLRVGTDFVMPSAAVRDLGIYLDSDMSTSSHVRKTVSTCFAVLRQLRSIRRSVSRPVVQSLVTSLVFSRLNYSNALNIFFGSSSQWWMQLLY